MLRSGFDVWFRSVMVFLLYDEFCIPPDIVHVVFLHTIGVSSIRAHSVDRKVSLYVVDDKRRVVDIPHSRSWCRPQVASCAWGRRLSRSILRILRASRGASRGSFGGVRHVETLRIVEDPVAFLAW